MSDIASPNESSVGPMLGMEDLDQVDVKVGDDVAESDKC